MIRSFLIQGCLYILCLYDIYLYLPDLLGLFNFKVYLPTSDYLTYFDAAMLLLGGAIIGTALVKIGNKRMGWVMILMNIIFTPLFIWKAIS